LFVFKVEQLDKIDTVDNAVTPWTRKSCVVAGFRVFAYASKIAFVALVVGTASPSKAC